MHLNGRTNALHRFLRIMAVGPRLLSSCATRSTSPSPLTFHTLWPLRRTLFNRAFAALYVCAVIALFYRHARTLIISSGSQISFCVSLSLLIADLALTLSWVTSQACRMYPIRLEQFPEKLKELENERDFPALDVFICTADPYKEPPTRVVNTALSLMAYDYPTDKITVYVSDDGGSALTLFAFMEAAKFASYWLPFCKEKQLMERSPDEYFASYDSHQDWSSETEKIKVMYENMKDKVQCCVEKGYVEEGYIKEYGNEIFSKWTEGFTSQDHPTVIQVLLDSTKDKDIRGCLMPNLIYLSREKSRNSHHNFKAGALNVLLRVSAVMTNAPIILTQDCDMYSNDPQTPLRALCYLLDPKMPQNLGYVQFPQRFRGINRDDTYGSQFKDILEIYVLGLDGLSSIFYMGTGNFFRRRVFFGGPSNPVPPENPQLNPPSGIASKPPMIRSQATLALAHHVAGCNYENQTNWGSKIGFRYGALVEDFYTGFLLQCEGWRSVLCNPDRAAFLGDSPITLYDTVNQAKRWCIGLSQVAYSKRSPLIFGPKAIGLLRALCYSNLAFWSLSFIPITLYAFLPQLALLNRFSIFPKISEPWFYLYVFLFLGAYGQEAIEFVLARATFRQWWNAKRMWFIRGISSFLFAAAEYSLKSLGFSAHSFGLTSKVIDDEQSKRYEQGIFEFGVASPMFVPLTTAAIINLFAFVRGAIDVVRGSSDEGLYLQMLLTGLIVLDFKPIYEGIALRNDRGRMPTSVTIIATFLAGALYAASCLIF